MSFFPPRAQDPQDPNAPLTRETWLGLFASAVKETGKCVVIHQGAYTTGIGQKPLRGEKAFFSFPFRGDGVDDRLVLAIWDILHAFIS